MAFDAGMTACLVHEFNEKIKGLKVEKIHQPSKDEIVLVFRYGSERFHLLLCANSNNPRVCLCDGEYENPIAAPMFCMLLRKHLAGARLREITQPDFERVIIFTFDAYDELGCECNKYLAVEIMGKFSNIIFLNEDKKVVSACKIIDFSLSEKRQILPGMTYELPPKQNKKIPLFENKESFISSLSGESKSADKYIVSAYSGISPLVAREIVYLASHATDTPVCDCDGEKLWFYFNSVINSIKSCNFFPCVVRDDGKAVEYSFIEIRQYGARAVCEMNDSPSVAVEKYFSSRSSAERIKQKSQDILRLLTAAESRLQRKTEIQQRELADCAKKEEYKLFADLINANIYRIKKGADKALLENYYSESGERIEIPLDSRLTPAANAQRFYKKYNKAKHAEAALTRQLELDRADLDYVYTVFDSLSRASTAAELDEIREELYNAGFASRMKGYVKKKQKPGKPISFISSDGYRILCGKNNLQNDALTFKSAEKHDYWFHVKGAPGSHVILCCNGQEPPSRAFTEAATVAATYSKMSDSENVAVDYTLVKNVKKPAGAKPGYVIYHTNWSAYVTPDKALCDKMMIN